MTVLAPLALPDAPEAVVPRAALLLYTCGRRLVATAHPLAATRSGRAAIGAGRPLSCRELHGWLAALAGEGRRAGAAWLPPEVLASEEDTLIWWRPARRAPMWFRVEGHTVGLRVPWPPLVFVARRQSLWCAALTANARPKPHAALCHAPLMNVDREGAVCLGTAEAPPDCAIERRGAWEAAVCATAFTHVNHPDTLRREGPVGTGGHLEFWRGLDGARRFPAEALAPRRQTLTAWWEALP